MSYTSVLYSSKWSKLRPKLSKNILKNSIVLMKGSIIAQRLMDNKRFIKLVILPYLLKNKIAEVY